MNFLRVRESFYILLWQHLLQKEQGLLLVEALTEDNPKAKPIILDTKTTSGTIPYKKGEKVIIKDIG